jgi:hypothetical protein
MIRHLPIKHAPFDLKKKVSDLVQEIINNLVETKGIYNEEIIENIKSVEAIVFNTYEIEPNARDFIISDICKRIDFFKKVYS